FVIIGLVLSGLTAFPLKWELDLLARLLVGTNNSWNPDHYAGLARWILRVREGLENTYHSYPFIAYGTDWLAFGHLVIALFFIPVWRDPVRYRGTILAGIASCVLVVPLALICGPIRGIPFYWQLIDCSFGVVAIVPLLWILHITRNEPAVET
ncbi:MAG: hypothetical protein AAF514_10820, partial [Verrucomicrobiota bacterium]